RGACLAARLAGRAGLDESGAEARGRQLALLADGAGCATLELDLGGVRYMTSSALGCLAGVHRRLRAAGGRLVVRNAEPLVAEALALTRLDSLFEVRRAPRGVNPGDAPAA